MLGAACVAAFAGRAFANQRRRRVLFVTYVRTLPSATLDLLRQGLHQAGFPEGPEFAVEVLFEPSEIAAAVAREQPDVIFATGPASVRAAAQASATIPIVAFDLETDPVGAGFVKSLARPGGNVTGIFLDQPELAGKWLQLLSQVAPGAKRVAAIWDATTGPSQRDALVTAAGILGLDLAVILFEPDLAAVLAQLRAATPDALVLLSSPFVSRRREQLAAFAQQARLRSVSMFPEYARSGGLLAYGPNVNALRLRAAEYVARILRGTQPADMPIERPSAFKLIVNLRVAAELGLTVPALLLQIADEVIE